jgi:hypothetical protein
MASYGVVRFYENASGSYIASGRLIGLAPACHARAVVHAEKKRSSKMLIMMGRAKIDSVNGLFYSRPFPWEHRFGFHRAGMIGDDFFQALYGDL